MKSVNELEKEFIKEFKRFRRENNLTQQRLSNYTNTPRTKIARIESMSSSPSINTLLNILGPLGYTIRIEKINKENY